MNNKPTKSTEYYSKQLKDNGPKWGSFVGKNSDGVFNFDADMKKNRPDEWKNMIIERISFLNGPGEIYPQRRTYKK
jgi:hypothetical protein